MPTLDNLVSAILATVNDPDVDEETVVDLINEGYSDVAGRVLLPKLETSDTITTSTSAAEVAAPSDLDRNLFSCASEDGEPTIKVLSSMALMLARFPRIGIDDTDGEVEYVCISGDNIAYHPVPATATDLLIRYYKPVTALSTGTSLPSAIPTRFQKRLLHSYACRELFNDIEDGIEGQKVNTMKYEQRYNQALAELDLNVQQGQARPVADRPGAYWF